jgi:excisionase family DNA binding protein
VSSSNDNSPVYTVTELCKRWKCDRHSILDAIREGRLRAFKIGKRAYRIALPEVLRYELVLQAA